MTGPTMRAAGPVWVGRRSWAVNAVIIMMVGGSLASIAADVEYWPFSPYPMYSQRVRLGLVSDLQLVGVTDGQPEEISLKRQAYIRPFDWVRLRRALERILERPDQASRLQTALRDLLVRYEAHRIAGHSHRPRLRAIRLYRVSWNYVSPETPKTPERISERKLLAEVQ